VPVGAACAGVRPPLHRQQSKISTADFPSPLDRNGSPWGERLRRPSPSRRRADRQISRPDKRRGSSG
jgi:hypothetical protein